MPDAVHDAKRLEELMNEEEVYMTLKVMLEDGAFPPSRSFPTDAGLDLCCREEFVLWPRHSHTFDTGVHIRIPPGYYGKVEGRSGLNRDFSVTPTGGVIDETYTGSIGVKLYNFGKEDKVFHPGDRIAQLVIQPCIQPEIEFVDALEETDRGGSGFGSTGA